MEYKQIQELIKLVNKTNLSELKISKDDFKITIRTKDYISSSSRNEPVQQITLAAPAAPVQNMPVQSEAQSSEESSISSATTQSTTDKSREEYDLEKFEVFKSPMIGTFYRRPAPDKEIFANVGDNIKTGDVLCIIEAMKLFNEIEFEGEGIIAKVLVEDATPVEYDQPLFLIEKVGS